MWSKATLGQIADEVGGSIQTGPFGSQLHQSDYQSYGTPVVMPQNIVNDKITEDSISYVDDVMVRKLSRHVLQVGDIVYPRRGELNKRAIISQRESGWLCGTGCVKISLTNSPVFPSFLFYYLKQSQVVKWIENKAVGSTMLNLNTGILRSLEVQYPNYQTQQRIAEILSNYDRLIDNNNRRIALLEESIHLLYKEWFVRSRFPGYESVKVVDGIPEGWNRKRLKDIALSIRQSIHPSNTELNTPYVGLEHIPRQSIALTSWGYSHEVDSNKFVFTKGDILFGKIRPYFHKVVFAPVNGICSSDAIVIRPINQDLFGLTLSLVSSVAFVDYTSKTSKEGSKMPRANWDVMEQYPILIPSPKLLQEFNTLASLVTNQITSLIFTNQRLRQARDLLLPRLINGSIAV
ncbi:MAG: restriction endonuclease subunit S [Nostoc sp.]|uniref:restriction endonuclease subunit S n=1 Tax=Nostoc sp. TaxID=1180 RepID=UPI002FFC17C7